MLILLTTAALGGFLLGLRFRVLILLPAMLLGLIAALAVARHGNVVAIVISAAATIILLELGYVIGSIVQTYWSLRVEVFSRGIHWHPTRSNLQGSEE